MRLALYIAEAGDGLIPHTGGFAEALQTLQTFETLSGRPASRACLLARSPRLPRVHGSHLLVALGPAFPVVVLQRGGAVAADLPVAPSTPLTRAGVDEVERTTFVGALAHVGTAGSGDQRLGRRVEDGPEHAVERVLLPGPAPGQPRVAAAHQALRRKRLGERRVEGVEVVLGQVLARPRGVEEAGEHETQPGARRVDGGGVLGPLGGEPPQPFAVERRQDAHLLSPGQELGVVGHALLGVVRAGAGGVDEGHAEGAGHLQFGSAG